MGNPLDKNKRKKPCYSLTNHLVLAIAILYSEESEMKEDGNGLSVLKYNNFKDTNKRNPRSARAHKPNQRLNSVPKSQSNYDIKTTFIA